MRRGAKKRDSPSTNLHINETAMSVRGGTDIETAHELDDC